MARGALVACGLLCAGCLDSEVVRCADGRLCPAGAVCDEARDRCLTQEQVDACSGREDGDACVAPGVSDGLCVSGACESSSCGDGIADALESCDRDDLRDQSCSGLGFYDGGDLGCTPDCRYDTRDCVGYCGDAVINGDEVCDGDAIGDHTCESVGFYQGGTLGCTLLCELDVGQCMGGCGDGVAGGPEECDGDDLRGNDCTALGFYEPEGLACGPACRFDASACIGSCGDGEVSFDGGEMCDGAAPAGETCLEYGFDRGALGCSAVCTVGFGGCGYTGWVARSVGFAGVLAGVWGADIEHVYAVGEIGSVFFFDGSDWNDVSSDVGSTASLTDVSGSSANDVWVISINQAHHFDGSGWTSMSHPVPGGRVAFAAPGAFFVGGVDGRVGRYVAGAWTEWVFGDGSRVEGVHGLAADDVWASTQGGAVYHFDGNTWTLRASHPTSTSDLWVLPDGEVLVAATGAGFHRYDGVRWRWVPQGAGASEIAGPRATRVFTAGIDVINLYDGIESHRYLNRRSVSVYALWADGAGNAVGVGEGGIAMHYTGAGFTLETGSVGTDMRGLYGADARTLHAAGSAGIWGRVGAGWSTLSLSGQLERVWSSAHDDVFVVGAGGAIQHFDGVGWSTMSSGTTQRLNGVWGAAAGDVFAVGDGGVILRYDGSAWSPMVSGTSARLRDVWGAAPDDVYAVGLGVVLHFDGSTWTELLSFSVGHLTSVWGSGAGDVWAVGLGGWVLRYDGANFTQMSTGTNEILADVFGLAADDVFIASESGHMWHWNGAILEPLAAPTVAPLTGVWGAGGLVYATTSGGVVHRFERERCDATEVSCTDLVDNDCDGAIDCDDSDCAGACAVDRCAGATAITCSGNINGSTAGGPTELASYTCLAEYAGGSERVYRFVSATSRNVTVNVTPNGGALLDIVVMAENAAGSCDPGVGCVIGRLGDGAVQGTFTATAGVPYYIAVDSLAGFGGTYSINLSCL